MAVTASFVSHTSQNPIPVNGDVRIVLGEVGTTGTYETGGFALAPALFGLDSIISVSVGHSSAAGIHGRWKKSDSKVLVWDEDDTSGIEAELSNGASLTASFPVQVWGRKAS